MRYNCSTLLILLLIPALCLASDTLQVARVIDGDTFEVSNGERVRLIGVDTPETVHPNKPVEYFGKEASDFTKKLLEGKTVRLEYDQQKRDKYDRILAYVWVGDTFVNVELIKQGYAHAYLKYPFMQERMDYFRLLEQEAREAGRGLWVEETTPPGTQPNEQPATEEYWLNTGSMTLHNSNCKWYGKTKAGYYTSEIIGKDCAICGGAKRAAVIQKETPSDDIIVYVTKSGSKYHRAGCRYLSKSSIPISLEEAKKRYSPCSVCKPGQ